MSDVYLAFKILNDELNREIAIADVTADGGYKSTAEINCLLYSQDILWEYLTDEEQAEFNSVLEGH